MNTRFAVAVHILAFLHTQEGKPASSELLASSVNTHPSLIRRLVSVLNRAGLTRSEMGARGGAILARPAERINLLDVHRAVDGDADILAIHPDPNPACPVGRHIGSVLEQHIRQAEKAFERELRETTVAQLTSEVISAGRKTA